MQIRLVIGEQDTRYLDRLITYLESKHGDQLEIVSFTQSELCIQYLNENMADLILVDENFGIDLSMVKKYGTTACLAEVLGSQETDSVRYIEKYKKPDLIFKDILDVYAECGGKGVEKNRIKNGNCQTILVTGFSGGTGASTFAAALARAMAETGEKTLYLNLERTGSSRDYFAGPGNYSFQDIIFALKSKRADVGLKMESCVRQDSSGVWFFEPCDTAMYMLELNKDEMIRVITELQHGESYRYIIVDFDFVLGPECVEFMEMMDRIILINDGTEPANTHFTRTYQALLTLEEQMKICVSQRMALVYNRFSSSRSSRRLESVNMPVLGVIPPVKHAVVKEIIEIMLTKKEVFSIFKQEERFHE